MLHSRKVTIMRPGLYTRIAILSTLFLVAMVLLRGSAEAGCGCDKPPPLPAVTVPNFSFPGMAVTLFDSRFQAGQQWTVQFFNGSSSATTTATVVVKRNLTTSGVVTPQLVVTTPEIPVGPTTITASWQSEALTVLPQSFTVIAKPIMVSEQDTDFDILNYTTGVSMDGTVYLSIGGLDKVCHSIKFNARADGFPLRSSQGTTVIYNHQGFLIDGLTPQSVNHFTVRPEKKATRSDRLDYLRHSFAQYCAEHQPGAVREVDPTDPDWHLNGTPHVDYSTLIFAIDGTVNGAEPPAGSSVSTLSLNTQLGPGTEPWEVELPEEH